MLGMLAWNFRLPSGFTGLLGFGEDSPRQTISEVAELEHYVKPGSGGYDGQFYVQLAMDPSLRHEEFEDAIDAPAYRSRRILMPATAWLLGLGKPAWIIHVYSLLNIACWVFTAVLLLKWMDINDKKGLAKWVACLFSLGALDSVRFSLTDLPATLLIAVTIAFIEAYRRKSAVFTLAAAILTKETSMLAAIVFPQKLIPGWRSWMLSGLMFLVAVCPFLLWYEYVNSIFSSHSGISGNLALPFVGIAHGIAGSIEAFAQGDFGMRYSFRLVAIVGFMVQTGYLLIRRQPDKIWWRVGIVYGVLLLCLGDFVWHGYWAVCRSVLPLTFAFNILLAKDSKKFWTIWVAGNLTIIPGFIRFA